MLENLLEKSLALSLENAVTNTANNITVFEDRGFICVIRLTSMGHLCGYVATPNTHKINNVTYEYSHNIPLDCHGGITFNEEDSKHGITLLGFDCAHGFDYSPSMKMGDPANYRDVEYVSIELKRMVDQLLEIDSATLTSLDTIKQLMLEE